MFCGGNATIFVSDMDRAVHFYTKMLGLKLTQRFGNHWAGLEIGKLAIGLHPASSQNPAGRNGSITVGLELEGEIDEAVARLKQHGVRLRGEIARDEAGKSIHFEDPDGNLLYMIELAQWNSSSASSEAWAGAKR